MPSTPWTIRSRKRKTPASAPPARKRQRVSNDVEGTATSTACLKKQHTLTQLPHEWLPKSVSFTEEADLQPLSMPARRTGPRVAPAKLQKRDSTLTQMGFVDADRADGDLDDRLLADPGNQDEVAPKIPQVDGGYDSPRKPRTRKATATPADSKPSTRTKTANPAVEESQGYQPTKRKRKGNGTDLGGEHTPRRSSRRLASKTKVYSDPSQSFEYFAAALPTEGHTSTTDVQQAPRPPTLEIKDSTDVWDDLLLPSQRVNIYVPPRTPQSKRSIILSSQSPQSLRRSTQKRAAVKPPQNQHRTPLRPVSTNLPFAQLSPGPEKADSQHSTTGSFSIRKSSTSALARPSRKRRKSRVDDSQMDVYTAQATSSPPAEATPKAPERDTTDKRAHNESSVEIPPTSQLSSGLAELRSIRHDDTQNTLPDLSFLLGVQKSTKELGNAAQGTDRGVEGRGGESVDARDFATQHDKPDPLVTPRRRPTTAQLSPPKPRSTSRRAISPPITRSAARRRDPTSGLQLTEDVPTQIVSPPKGRKDEQADVEADSELGSPVHNDTQFNFDLVDRISSPIPDADITSTDQQKELSDTFRMPSMSPSKHPQGQEEKASQAEENQSANYRIPQPRLVTGNEATASTTSDRSHENGRSSPELFRLPPILKHVSTVTSTIRVPLNDISDSSSSPRLPSMHHATQRSVHPASMPHPSQISTQTPTQQLMATSSMPLMEHMRSGDRAVDRITIKDSSSMQVTLSQLPQFVEGSQSQLDIDLGIDEAFQKADEDDFDLDPASSPRLPPTMRDADDVDDDEEMMNSTPRPSHRREQESQVPSSPKLGSDQLLSSSPLPPPLKRKYSPIPGFDNDTQSNFTQDGHVTAAYIHRQHEAGVYPEWFVPQPYQVPGYTRRKKAKR